MSDYREACNEAKAVRRGIVEQRPIRAKARSKQAKPHVVEYRFTNPVLRLMARTQWSVFGRYATPDVAQSVVDNKNRSAANSIGAEYRVRP
jgi:hypothetical protein